MGKVDNLVQTPREVLRFVFDRINWCLDSNWSTTQQFDLTEIHNCKSFFCCSFSTIFRCATNIIIIMIMTISVITYYLFSSLIRTVCTSIQNEWQQLSKNECFICRKANLHLCAAHTHHPASIQFYCYCYTYNLFLFIFIFLHEPRAIIIIINVDDPYRIV